MYNKMTNKTPNGENKEEVSMQDNEEGRVSQMAFYHKLYEQFLKIKGKLGEQYLAVSDVLKILKITRRQLFYWDSKGLKVSKKKTAKRSWRKFSIADVFGFMVVKELLDIGIDIEKSKDIVADIEKDLFINTPYMLYFFGIGEPIYLVVDIERKHVQTLLGYHKFSRFFAEYTTSKPIILVPISNLLRATIESTAKEDFNLEITAFKAVTTDGHRVDPAVFQVDGEEIEFDMEDMESVEKIMNFDIEFKESKEEE
jgi:DNA-binding transcriptional MerR regulator